MSIPEVWGTTNVLEALRLVLALLLVLAAGVGFVRATDGRLAFARVIRPRMLRRRRIQMMVYLSIAIVWGIQTSLAASTPDPPVLSPPAIGVSLCTIYTLLSLGLLALHQLRGWRVFQEIVTRPLQPTPDELLEESSVLGRHLAHAAANDHAIVRGHLDLLSSSVTLTETERQAVAEASDALNRASGAVAALHALVRALAPPTHASQELPA